jgi:type IV pilus assembly protein PilA
VRYSNLHQRTRHDAGFTLVEILVVVLIIGILAAIAVPALLNQRHKAYDASVKSQIRKAAMAEELYSEDHATYASENIGPSDSGPLAAVEPTLKNQPNVTATANGPTGFTLVSTALGGGGDTFTYINNSGSVSRTCSGGGGGCLGGFW